MALWVGSTPVAFAQTGGITVTLVDIEQDGVTLQSGPNNPRPYNAAECASQGTVVTTYKLENVPSGITFVDAWLGNATEDCSTADARQSGDARQCTHLAADPDIQSLNGTVTLTLSEMLDPSNDSCESSPSQGEEWRLWFFATGSSETTGAVTADQYGLIEFTVDSAAPAAPAISGGTDLTGDTRVDVSWGTNSEVNTTYNTYVDTSVGTCTDAGMYAPGDEAPATATRTNISGGGTAVDLESAGLAIGQSALVYVARVDYAENTSVLSEAVCVTRIETVGFCDALSASGEECTNSCSAGGRPARPGFGGWLALLTLTALAYRRRVRA